MGRNAIETVLGALVIMVAALFVAFAYSSADLQQVKGYTVSVKFPMVDGLKEGGDVRVNGVKIGSILGMNLITDPGPSQYLVDVSMSIDPKVRLPVDTIAMAASESLLGGKYLSLEVGVDEDYVKTDGTGKLSRAQSPMRLDDLIGQLIYSSKKSDDSGSAAPSADVPPVSAAPSPIPVEPAQIPANP